MSEHKPIKTGLAMVRISGSKMRGLREEQNLTQLYLATAVGVTTETISRWERQEAPTVKEENGVKLADVLAVPLQDLLAPPPPEQEAEKKQPAPAPLAKRKSILLAAAAVVIIGTLAALFFSFDKGAVLHLAAKRFVPAHTASGHSFPVVIEVDFVAEDHSSLLLKEQLPDGCVALQAVPQATVMNGGFLKWIDRKGTGSKSFSYMARCMVVEENVEPLVFNGSLLVRQSSHREVPVGGRSRIRLNNYHWADSDKDHIVGDEELLAVYDDFDRVQGLEVDVEEVESIWMGSGYRWVAERSEFDIIP